MALEQHNLNCESSLVICRFLKINIGQIFSDLRWFEKTHRWTTYYGNSKKKKKNWEKDVPQMCKIYAGTHPFLHRHKVNYI